MGVLSVAPRAVDDARIAGYFEPFANRIAATPPGMCPIAMQYSLLQASAVQTCGKCVPCRDGLPQMARLLKQVLDCEADAATLEQLRTMATMARTMSDCAIGYEAAGLVLRGLDDFAAEYESHIEHHECRQGIGQTVPCETLCPAHVNIPAYIALAEAGDYAGAVQMIRKDNPFPTACAYVCEHPCENRCRRMLIDAPVNIRGIKKYAVENAPADTIPTPKPGVPTGRRIAVVGGGPAGLTCAYFLGLMGHSVVVYEARNHLGGMMRYGIPAYRLPREELDRDIRAIVASGDIDVRLNTIVDNFDMLREYDAVFLGIGAQVGKTLDMPGNDADGVMSAVDLLGSIGDGNYPDFTGKKVVVVGGGNVAMDCARTSVRAGADEVTVVYRRRIDDMTALREEIDSAIAEGVEMMTLQAPVRVEADGQGCCTALITQPQRIGPVKRGRPAPVKASAPEQRVEADIVLIAVGQDVVSTPIAMPAEPVRFKVDENLHSLTPGHDNVFIGGDCQTGPKTVIMAIGAGKVAARNIDEFLGYHHKLDCGVDVPPARQNDRAAYGRVNIAERPARERKRDFAGVELSMTVEEAQQECGRCLRCDHFGCGVLEEGRVQYA